MKTSPQPLVFIAVAALFLLSLPMILPAIPNQSQVQAASAGTKHLGFWLQEPDIYEHYSAPAFFNAMFLTPPYPSSLEVMIFGIQQDESNGYGCSASAHYVGESVSYWGQVAQLADAYPNIRLIFEIAFDPSSGGSGTYGLSCFNTIVQGLSKYPSVYGLGVEGEYTTVSGGMTETEMQSAMNYVVSGGKAFINYYAPVPVPTGGYDIHHTNFPGGDSGGYDQVGTLGSYDAQSVGIDSGYYASYQFPGTVTCPIGASAMNSATAGWNQCVVSTELGTAVSFSPASARQFLEIDVGFSSSGSFTGVSGQTTNQVWDNPSLRNWVWNDPNYQNNFVLSTSPATTTTSSTTSSSATKLTSTSTTRATSSASTSALSTSSSTSTSTASTSKTSSSTTRSTSSSSTTRSSTSSVPSYTLSTFVGCPSGIPYCGTAYPLGTGTYASGSSVSLQALPYGGFQFSSWNICNGSCKTFSSNPMNLNMSTNTFATATFVSQGGGSVTTTTTSTSTLISSDTTSVSSSSSVGSSQTSSQSSSQSTSSAATSQAGIEFALSVVGNCAVSGTGSYPQGSVATIQFDGVCERTGGSGLRVDSWSVDGGAGYAVDDNSTNTIQVLMDGAHTVTLHSVPQYRLTLDYGAQISLLSLTPPTVPRDGLWYDNGTAVSYVGATSVQGFNVVSWGLNSPSSNPISGSSTFTASFQITGPRSLETTLSSAAVTGKTFDVTVQTDTTTPSGVWIDGSYFKSAITFAWQIGSQHNVTAVGSEAGQSSRSVFSRWFGIADGTSRTVVITVNGSGYLTADYTTQLLVSLEFSDASGHTLTPQSVTISGPQGAIPVGPNHTAWVDEGSSYRLTSVMWMNTDVVMQNDSSFSPVSSGSFIFSLSVYPQTIEVSDVYGLPVRGATVNVSTSSGITMSLVTDSQGQADFRVPYGLYSANVAFLGASDLVVSGTEGSHVLTVSFLMSYPLLVTMGTVSACVFIYGLYRYKRKPKDESAYYYYTS